MNKILLVGSNSFVGRNFFKYSSYRNIDEVSLLDKLPDEIEFSNYDTVIHLAAIVHQSKEIPENKYFEVNRDLCLDVAKNAKLKGVRQFIFLSTVKVYGNTVNFSNVPDEDTPCIPDDPYGKSKLSAEKALFELNDNNFVVSVIRTPLVYGEGVKANMFSMIRLVDICPVLPFKGIDNKRSFDYIENLVGFLDRIIELRAAGIFLAMDEISLSTTELITLISESLNKKRIMIKLPGFLRKLIRISVPEIYMKLFGSYQFQNFKTLRALDYKPKFTSDYGITKTVEWYMSTKNK
jgi:UDP-glucose 4-epimerase